MIDLSVIIVNWNTKEYLKGCLKSLLGKKKVGSFEVFVVDNASSDGSGGMVRAKFPHVTLLENKENVGFARANNQAIKKCRGEFVLLLNPDTFVGDRCLEEMLDFMEMHPEAGASGCRILNAQGELEPFRTAKRFPTPLTKFFVDVHLDRLFPRIKFFGRFSMTDWNRDDEREVDIISGAFMFLRKKTIEEVGLLDERFFLLAEDIDWCRRIKQKGWKIVYNPRAEIIHYSGKAIDQVPSARLKNSVYSYLLYFRKHHTKRDVFCFRILQSVTHILKTAYWALRLISQKNRKVALLNVNAHFRAIFYSFISIHGFRGQ